MPIITIEEAIKDIKAGRMVILCDDEDRENEGDLTMAAEAVTPEAINFMAKYGRGLICLSMNGEMIEALDLPMMVDKNTSQFETGFTVSIEARNGVTTGISAADRRQSQTGGPCQAGACIPVKSKGRRGYRPGGPNRGFRGSRAACRYETCRRYL